MIHVGFRKGGGEPVEVPLQHTIVASQTRYGKSTTIRHMMEGLPPFFKVIALDVKDPRDYEGAGLEVPIYIENRTDPILLKQLLERQSRLWLRKELPELIQVCKEGDSFHQVLEKVKARMNGKVHPVVMDRLRVLRLLLEKLIDAMGSVEISAHLRLEPGVNVMDLSKADDAVKQLAVYSTVKAVLKKGKNTVIVIDELPEFAPQGQGTPSKSMITQAIRKGGAKGVWLWLSGQTVTGVDKQVLKQAMIWILGHQRELNEAKRTLDQIPFKTGLKVEDVMTLPVGHFIVCTDEWAHLTYVQPSGVDAETARKVALGEISPREVMEDESVWKEKYERLKADYDKAKRELDIVLENMKKLEKKVEDLRYLEEWKAEYGDKHIKELKSKLEKANRELKLFNNLKTILGEILPTTRVQTPPSTPNTLSVNVTSTVTDFNVKVQRETLEASDRDLTGQILLLAANGWFDEKRRISTVRSELYRAYNVSPRPGTVETALADLVSKGILNRERMKGRAWLYWLRPEAKKRIQVIGE